MLQCTVKRMSRQESLFEDYDDASPLLSRCLRLDLARRFVVSETLAGRSLSAIGNELGMSRQAAHYHLRTAARALGLDYGRFRSLADGVIAESRAERAAELRERSGRIEFDTPAPIWRGRRDTPAAGYSAELDALADRFLAGEWSPQLQQRAESIDALLRQGGH